MALVDDPAPTLSCYDEAFIDVNHASVDYENLLHHQRLLEECLVGNHPWELPVAGALDRSRTLAKDGCWGSMGGVSSSSPSSSVVTFDRHGDDYCAAWTDDVGQHSYGLSPAHTASASQKRPRADAPWTSHLGADQEDVAAPNPKKQCGSSSRRTTTTKHDKAPTATAPKDPQNLVAKNRRERISERLRALQELVPNGSKVDTVTMLDKAITYVKFMQLQLKVLETDAFWPTSGGDAPKMSQVEDALNAILLSHSPTELATK